MEESDRQFIGCDVNCSPYQRVEPLASPTHADHVSIIHQG